jgi:dTDP-4-amino-4,6-dideoxygalactose transaminase
MGEERIFLSAPDVGAAERDALVRAFDSGWVAPAGPELDAFERELGDLVGWPGVTALSSGTAALHLALVTEGIGPGDTVLASTFTFAGSVNPVSYVGADLHLIDSDTESWNLSPELLAEALTAAKQRGTLPKAVIAVDLYGQCADFDAIRALCDEDGVLLIEDAAEAVGATYRGRPAGSLGDLSILSFNGNKIVTTSGGGAYLSPDPEKAQRVRYLSTQARQPVVHYEHTEVGFNYRLSNLLAALGRAQLTRLPGISKRRLGFNAVYREELADLSGLSFMPIPDWSSWNGWLTCAVFEDATVRDRVVAALEAANIESRPLWKPMHLQPLFAGVPAVINGVSEHLFRHGLCLPSGSGMTDADLERVISVARGAITTRP